MSWLPLAAAQSPALERLQRIPPAFWLKLGIAVAAIVIAVIVLRTATNRLDDLRVLVPNLLTVIPISKEGEVTWVESASQ